MSKRALVTGASRGIGAAIAERLALAGHRVILNYRGNHAAAEALLAKIVEAGGQAELACFDVADPDASGRAMQALVEKDPEPITIVVNNAGITQDGPFPGLSAEQWTRVTRTSLDGFFNVTQPLVMPMVRKRWGRIINITSISGLIGHRGQTNYSAAKAGLIGATRSLAQELAKRNITVNAIAPGLIETDMIKDLDAAMLKKIVPMQRLGKPSEVAELVHFLAGDNAAYITGQVITISGGLG
ncbi:MAG TPA: 3-oxoacyl-ACP reductase FabG [Polyangiales bacterium]|nr:3-oxoacyl-ACP reductase FabG [Polyangiales bacterium]